MSTLIGRQDDFSLERAMSPEVEGLWSRIEAHSLDEPAVTDHSALAWRASVGRAGTRSE